MWAMSNYTIGRSYEYRAKKQLEAEGFQVVRSAGSHSEWDLIAVKPGIQVRCIQIKRTKSERGMKQLLRAFQPTICGGPQPWRSELWVWYKGRWYTSIDWVEHTAGMVAP